MRIVAALVLSWMLFSPLTLWAQEEWELETNKEGIMVYSRSSAQSKFNELKLECTVDASLSALVAVLLDVNDYSQWVYHTSLSKLLRKVNEQELYFYTQIESPFGSSNRDLAVHLRISQDQSSKVVQVLVNSVPDYVPKKESFVRVPLSDEHWTISPIGPHQSRILYSLRIDPGGSVPAWLVNQFSSKGPYQSFRNLRKQVAQDKYTKAVIPFIVNAGF